MAAMMSDAVNRVPDHALGTESRGERTTSKAREVFSALERLSISVTRPTIHDALRIECYTHSDPGKIGVGTDRSARRLVASAFRSGQQGVI